MKLQGVRLLLVITLILIACISPVFADSYLTFRDASLIPGHGFVMYEVNGTATTPLGILNTSTDAVHLDPNSSYILQYTIQNSDYIDNPISGVTYFVDFVIERYPQFIVIGFLLLLFAIAWKWGFG